MPNRPRISCALTFWLAASALVGFGSAAEAQERRFAGTWRIESVALAPWAESAAVADLPEQKRLIGKTVTFGARAVVGPEPLGCVKPAYAIRNDGPDMLFEGSLAEPDPAGKPRDAAALARGLGMKRATVATLSVGCAEIEFHALTPDTLAFGLNNAVYTMRRR